MGLNSGEVIVDRIGDDLRMDYTAQGHTVGLAQRMESLAEPNTCYLTAATAALDSLGEFPVKGVAAPVRVHRLSGSGASRTHLGPWSELSGHHRGCPSVLAARRDCEQ